MRELENTKAMGFIIIVNVIAVKDLKRSVIWDPCINNNYIQAKRMVEVCRARFFLWLSVRLFRSISIARLLIGWPLDFQTAVQFTRNLLDVIAAFVTDLREVVVHDPVQVCMVLECSRQF